MASFFVKKPLKAFCFTKKHPFTRCSVDAIIVMSYDGTEIEGSIKMFGIVKRITHEVKDKTVYMEIFGDNKVAYRVLSGRLFMYGDEFITYGIEVIDRKSGEKECIPDFSRNIEDAVAFAELLISERCRPRKLYSKALDFLRVSI